MAFSGAERRFSKASETSWVVLRDGFQAAGPILGGWGLGIEM